ncbi:MAG: DUF4080 domain-containing protein [Gammaproteobacteria bacterium]|jgi:hypothetical protein
MTPIILSTLNARYIHSALGLRYLYANLQELKDQTTIREFTLDTRPVDLAEKLLLDRPRIIGLAVYIWNVAQTTELVSILKQVSPDTTIVLGGPEVSYETDRQPIIDMADYVITGQADLEFQQLCRQILDGAPPVQKVIPARPFPLSQLVLPYEYYTDKDIASRMIYVEASRGCPFRCEFCLSALDKTAWPFQLEDFLNAMQKLYERGARHFKFVDRTFNLKIDNTIRILQFFLDKQDDNLFLHFELIPDQLPDKLKAIIQQFAEGTLQFEIGIQTFDPEVQQRISRKQDNDRACENINWLRQETSAHLHTDLIAGLPGEDIAGFARGFNRLVALNPHEIQVGILKRLKGAPIDRHSETHAMVYNPNAPYNILANDQLDFAATQSLSRFARYWDMIANSGRFNETLPLLLADNPFENFMAFSNWLFAATGQTHRIALPRLFDLVHQALTTKFHVDENVATAALLKDYQRTGLKGKPVFMKNTAANSTAKLQNTSSSQDHMHAKAKRRQSRHIANT